MTKEKEVARFVGLNIQVVLASHTFFCNREIKDVLNHESLHFDDLMENGTNLSEHFKKSEKMDK